MDKISIYNEALGRIGVSLALTGENDAGSELTVCNRFFDSALADVLSACPWRCVRAVKKLARVADGENPRWDYLYCFPLPADYLAVIPELMPRARWEIAGGNFFSDFSEVLFYYTAKPDNVGVLAPHVANCVVLKLAIKIAPALLKGASQLLREMMTEYDQITLREAMALEVRESFRPQRKVSWIDHRGGR